MSLVSLAPAKALASDDWKPIDPADLASNTPVVEKDADAEGLFWEVRVDDGQASELVFTNYVRVKVYTERGKESQSKIDLPYRSYYAIKDIAARTVRTDGTIVELKKDEVFERIIVKGNGVKVKAKSFAIPGVEPGAIVEYRWREERIGRNANYVALQFQRDIPVRIVTYLVRPLTGAGLGGMNFMPFHMPPGLKFETAKNGFYQAQLTNVPAFHEEPRIPPENEVRSWILLYYSHNQAVSEDRFWTAFGKAYYETVKDATKGDDEVRSKAAEIVGDALTAEGKLERIYEFCHTKIRNFAHDELLTAEEKSKFRPNKSPAETLKRGVGTAANIDNLFAALSSALGFEAHIALSGDRADFFLDRAFTDLYFLYYQGVSSIAVKVNDKWQFFRPGHYYSPFGMLRWQEDGQYALIIAKEPQWAVVPMSGPDKSVQKSTGKFRLGEDGTLEGDVRIEYTGQLAMDHKYYNDDDSPPQREATLRNLIKTRMSTAELTNIKIENVTDPVKPFIYDYHVRVPGYAQRTGKRLFLQPAFFEHGSGPLFPASQRQNSIYFHYPWSEEDTVTIEIPEGYTLDGHDSPHSFNAADVSQYKVTVGTTQNNKTLVLKRSFFFGGGDKIIFPVTSYAELKAIFDRLNKEDSHIMALEQSGTVASQ